MEKPGHAEKKEEGLSDPFGEKKGAELSDPFAATKEEKEEGLSDPFASVKEQKEDNPSGPSKSEKEEVLNDPFGGEKKEEELADPFGSKKEVLVDPFAAPKEENKEDMFAMSEKTEELHDPFKKEEELTDPFAAVKKEENPPGSLTPAQEALHDPFAAEKGTIPDPFSVSTTPTTQPASLPIRPKLRPGATPLNQTINSIFTTSNSPVVRRRSSLRTSSLQGQRSLRRSLSSQNPAVSIFDGISATPSTASDSLFTFDSVTPPTPSLSRFEKREKLYLSTDDDYLSVAQRIGVFLTPMAEETEKKPARVVDVVSFFENDDEFSADIEDGQRLRVIFDNMLPVVNDKPVLPDPDEMIEQVERKAEALAVLLDSISVGWGMGGQKKKLQRQIRAIEEEECVFEADYDIRVCEKWG